MCSDHSTPKTDYIDKKIGLILYPVLGISFVFFANDNPFSEHIRLPSFTSDVVFALTMSLLIGVYLGWLVRLLDKKRPWGKNYKKRLLHQLLFGLFVPLVTALVFEVFYLRLINIPFSESAILNLELPLTFIYLTIINLFYVINYLVCAKRVELRGKDPTDHHVPHITVQYGATEKAIRLKECAVIKSSEKVLWLHTFDNMQFQLQGTLAEWENKVPKKDFYRLNRQYIVTRNAIKHIEQTATRRLKVYFNHSDEVTFVSKTNAANFKKWWKGDRPLYD